MFLFRRQAQEEGKKETVKLQLVSEVFFFFDKSLKLFCFGSVVSAKSPLNVINLTLEVSCGGLFRNFLSE